MDKKIRISAVAAMLFFLAMLARCGGKETVSPGFVRGEDWQYPYMDEFPQNQKLAEDEDGAVYFMSGSYIFKHDPATKTTLPLCNRPNCLHNQETDARRREECHAFLPLGNLVEKTGGGVAYCKGEVLAYYSEMGSKSEGIRVDAISRDGGSRRVVQRLPYAPESFAVHRGKVYFSYGYFDEEGHGHTEVGSFGLFGGGIDVLYNMPVDAHTGPILLFPVGNAVYYTFYGKLGEEEGESRSFLFRYDILKKENREIRLTETEKYGYISGIVGLKERVLVDAALTPASKEGGPRHVLFALDSSGNSQGLFAEDVPGRFYSDGERLYLSESGTKEAEWVSRLTSLGELREEVGLKDGKKDAEEKAEGYEPESASEEEIDHECKVMIMDPSGRAVGSFTEEMRMTAGGMPYYDICFGVGNYGYLLQQISAFGGSVLYRVDKAKMKDLQGGLLPMEKVSEIFLSPADQDMIGDAQMDIKTIPGYIYENRQLHAGKDKAE